MTDTDKTKALEILTSAEVVTGMDLSTVRWGVARQGNTELDPLDNDTTVPVEETPVPDPEV
jgi:hypothetical protein